MIDWSMGKFTYAIAQDSSHRRYDPISQLPLNSLKLTNIDNDLTKIVLKIHPSLFLIIFAARIASVFLYEKYPTIRDLYYCLHFLERPRKFLSRLTARTNNFFTTNGSRRIYMPRFRACPCPSVVRITSCTTETVLSLRPQPAYRQLVKNLLFCKFHHINMSKITLLVCAFACKQLTIFL